MDTLKVGDIVLITDENDQKCGLHATVLRVDDGGGHCQLEFSFEVPKVKSWYFDYQFDLSPDPARQQAQPADGEGAAVGFMRPCEDCNGTGARADSDGMLKHCRVCDGTGIYSEGKDLPDDEVFLQSLAQRDADVGQLEAQVATLTRELASTRAELAAAKAERDEWHNTAVEMSIDLDAATREFDIVNPGHDMVDTVVSELRKARAALAKAANGGAICQKHNSKMYRMTNSGGLDVWVCDKCAEETELEHEKQSEPDEFDTN